MERVIPEGKIAQRKSSVKRLFFLKTRLDENIGNVEDSWNVLSGKWFGIVILLINNAIPNKLRNYTSKGGDI